ncbi:uncharacterized protein NPIL_535341 [Nephila pilipes]|uniref:Ig-like domain-containing protein n=1 Tax=Nephila pilipes TaxID=299642 RepID=A0A8X6TXF6_NEPPI|nr:uncharacterized protein NPIL_535341 [Nephila pilipes]
MKIKRRNTMELSLVLQSMLLLMMKSNALVASADDSSFLTNDVKSYILEGPILFIDIGSPVNLTCEVEDVVGILFLFWNRNGTVLTKQEMYNRGIEYFMVLGTYSKSRLFVAKAKFSDARIYSCHPSYANPTNIILLVVNVILNHTSTRVQNVDATTSSSTKSSSATSIQKKETPLVAFKSKNSP